jgi:hypothetical protein
VALLSCWVGLVTEDERPQRARPETPAAGGCRGRRQAAGLEGGGGAGARHRPVFCDLDQGAGSCIIVRKIDVAADPLYVADCLANKHILLSSEENGEPLSSLWRMSPCGRLGPVFQAPLCRLDGILGRA